MAEEFSPEEKLLRLIRGKAKEVDKPTALKAASPKGPAEMTSSAMPTTQCQPRTIPVVTDERRYLKYINSALITVLIITVAFFVYDLVSFKFKRPALGAVNEAQTSSLEFLPQISEPGFQSGEAQRTPFSTYSEAIGSRELFKPLRPGAQTEKAPTLGSESAYDKLKDLSLIGIIAGERPQAVIEDKKIQKTYFLYKGQTINQMKVEEILKDRVILDYYGEMLELAL